MLEPTLAEVITAAIDAQFLRRHFSLPGEVIEYHAELQTVDVQPVIKSPLTLRDGTIIFEKLPVVHDCPVAFQRGGGCALTFPLEAGDAVTLLFSEVCTAEWRETGQLSNPGDLEHNSLSYPIAIPGISPIADVILPTGYSANEVVLSLGSGKTARVGSPAATPVALAAALITWAANVTAAVNTLAPGAVVPLASTVAATKLKAE